MLDLPSTTLECTLQKQYHMCLGVKGVQGNVDNPLNNLVLATLKGKTNVCWVEFFLYLEAITKTLL